MTSVNGTTAIRRLGVPIGSDAPQQQRALRPVVSGDAFDVTHTPAARVDATQGTSSGSHILRADTNSHVTAEHADVVGQTAHALSTVRESAAQKLAKANATVQAGDAMSHDDAVAKVVEIYSAAFPGVGFNEGELAPAIQMLQSGKVPVEELTARVQEGAQLVNDPNGMVDQARQQVPDEGRPNRRSATAQALRMDRLATLMEMGYLPEGKFNIAGGFSMTGEVVPVQGQFLSAKGETQLNKQATSAQAGLSRDMARSLELYTSTAKDSGSQLSGGSSGSEDGTTGPGGSLSSGGKRPSGKSLIKGSSSNVSTVQDSTKFGQPVSHQVNIPGATISSLKQTSSDLSSVASQAASPIMLDLNHDGKLGTTGVSTAKDRIDNVKNLTVNFDIDGDGKKDHIEWMNGDGDGMLVDDRDGGATAASKGNGEIDGTRLFGDQGGKYANGYEKLAKLDVNHDGKLTGHELDGLKTWIDDGDAKVEAGELKTLAELGVTSIDVKMQLTANDRGENLMRSTFTQNGQEHVSEDVWFAKGQAMPNLAATAAAVTERASGHTLASLVARIDSTLAQLDNVARQVEQAHSITGLRDQAHQVLLAHGFRA